MDPSDFPSPFDPLTLPEKPLAGDLPVDMEFGEDLLESQTAPTRGWAPPGPSPSSGALDLLDTPSGLEKDPGVVLDGATELLGLGGLLYKAPSPPEVDHGPEGTLAWDSGEQTLEPGPGCQTPEVMPPDPGSGASPTSPEGLLEPLAPDSPIILESPHIEEEEIPPIATRRRGSPRQEEEHTQGRPQSPNAPPSPSVGETLGDGINNSQTKPGVSIPAAHPSLPGDGLTVKESEKPPERKRSERVRRAEPPKPEVVDSTESIPVSDEDSDAMVDDPNDEDFVPFRPRRSPRMSLRSSMAQRAGRSSMGTKMSCAHCRTPLQKGQTAYQRKGLPQLFCSSSCLTTFSKKPLGRKTCTFCKKCVEILGWAGAGTRGGSYGEIWNTKDSVVIQTGSGGSFQEFCTSVCLSLYEAQQQRPIPQSGDPADATRCSICQKTGEVLHEVSNGSVVHRLCSDSCFSKFRANKGLKTNCCDQCGAYIYARPGSLGPELLFHDGQQKRFCNTTCLGAYKKRTSPEGGIHLSCHYCHSLFSGKPEVLEWQDQVFQFCCRDCCEDFKRLRGVVSQCEHCRQEKLLHEKLRFSGVEKSFCSEGCVLLYKQDFTKKLGLCCITCTYCSQTCQRGVTEQLDGSTWDFCSEDCKTKYLLWYCKAARCHACKRQGKLLETIHWRGQIRHFCNQQCLLRFYSQQNQPNLDTQSGPESLLNSQSSESKPQTPSQTKVENSITMRTPEENGNLGKVPVPMFLPTTLESTEKIVETIEELKVKIPSNPLEADILAMAEMIAEAEELDKASSDLCDLVSNQSAEGLLEDCDLFGTARDDVLAMAVKMANVLDEPGQDLEADFPKNPLDINPSVDFLFDCGLVGPEDVSTEQDLPRAMRKGQKRLVLSESCSRDSLSSQPSCTGLNYSYGVNAWKCWVQSKYANGESSKGDELRFGHTVFSRVEEEHLWECKQLGVYSPFVLLNTLMFFNTKFFGLQTAEEHMQLSFTNVVRQSRKCTTPRGTTKVVSIRYYAPVRQRKGRDTGPGKRKREDETILEQRENRMNPLRCPVKFYEFYLSKCPESLRTRNDVFYLQPERSCIAESPLWYSVIPMDRSMLESMLNRILAVREIYEELGRPGEEDLD
ncbi:zinc finger MYM-type 3 [Cricetulus griseus]